MLQPRFSQTASRRTLLFTLLVLGLHVALVTTSASAQLTDTFYGPPDSSALSPHVSFTNLSEVAWPLDCSAWPENTPDEGYLASVFGHRVHDGGADFHRGIDLRCNQHGKTCCKDKPTGAIYCNQTTCDAGDEEVDGAPIVALVGGKIKEVHDGPNNNLIVETTLTGNDITIGTTSCDKLYIWYQHMRTDYANKPDTPNEWTVGDEVLAGQTLGWQGKSGASSVHLHLSTRVCENSRADGDPIGTLDPEVNPFQLIGTDNGQAPQILSLSTAFDGPDLLVTVQIETDDPDFDRLDLTVYDAVTDQSHVRRLGYNSRYGINVAGDDLDNYLLQPGHLSELTAIQEPDPPVATSGFTLTARFQLSLASDPDSLVQVKVADVFGNTTVSEVQIFGSSEVGDRVWDDQDGDGLQDVGEPGLSGVDVELYSSTGTLLDSTLTDAQGNYSFTQLVAGDYFLRFQRPSGFGATIQVAGFPDLDSDVDPQTLETPVFSLASGQVDLSRDAGFTSACTDVTLVTRSSEWRVSDSYASGWNGTTFDDSGWTSLVGDIGYDEDDTYSEIASPGWSAYFRLDFEVEDVTLYDLLDLTLYRDDGAVVYLNGVEIFRSNMPAGPIQEDTRASSTSEATVTASFAASYLLPGTNVLAVEVHNRSESSDLMFGFELTTSICRPCLTEVTVSADAGTFIESGESDVFGTDSTIEIDGSPSEKTALLSWDLSTLPTDAEVLHAEILTRVTNSSSSDYRIFAMSRDWDEGTNWQYASGPPNVTWYLDGANGQANGATDFDSTPLGLMSLPGSPTFTGTTVLNVSGRATVEGWIEDSTTNHGLMIHGDSGQGNGLDIRSDETADPPQLRLVYASSCP